MAIFKKDLEKINSLNKNQKVNVKSEFIQLINFQNEASDYNFDDLSFEVDINFGKKFQKNKDIFLDITKGVIEQNKIDKLKIYNLFSYFNSLNREIFVSLERLIYQIKIENDLFSDELSVVSTSNKNSKKHRFDALHSFLLNNNREQLLSNKAGLSTTAIVFANLDETILGEASESTTRFFNLYQTFIDVTSRNSAKFLKTYCGFNFLDLDNNHLILNYNKPLSLMSLATSINNVINNSFDYASCNSLFKGIYTEDELNSKINPTQFTNSAIIENDISKEILPIKYVDNLQSISEQTINQFIDTFNSNLSSMKNIKKSNNENISKLGIFSFEDFLTSDNIEDFDFSANMSNLSINANVEYPDVDTQLPSEKLLDIITSNVKKDIVSINNKKIIHFYECLNMIANHVDSFRIKLISGSVTKNNNAPFTYEEIKFRKRINSNKKGILNYRFEDTLNFTDNILKTRLNCNNIVKTYKKYAINNGLDASSNDNLNLANIFLNPNDNTRSPIQKGVHSNNLLDVIPKMLSQTNQNNFLESFNEVDNLFEIFSQNKNKINQDLIIIDNSIVGESNAEAFIFNTFSTNIDNVNQKINLLDNQLNIGSIKNKLLQKHNSVKEYVNKYYNTSKIFKNTSTFFQELKKIAVNNFKWHLKKKSKTKATSDRADLLNNASILWLFNDYCEAFSSGNRELFQNNFVNLLISYLYTSFKRNTNNNFKRDYSSKATNVMNEYGPTVDVITEIAPFFGFFSSHIGKIDQKNITSINNKTLKKLKEQDNINRNQRFYNEYYNITEDIFESNGKCTHFLSVPCYAFENNMNLTHVAGHKLNNKDLDLQDITSVPFKNNDNKKNILLAGRNKFVYSKFENGNLSYSNIEYVFVPQLGFNFENANQIKYFIYNSAFMDNPEELFRVRENTLNDLENLMSYHFVTKNNFLNVVNFSGIISDEEGALTNNLFYQMLDIFKDIFEKINFPSFNNFNDLFTFLSQTSNKDIKDFQFMMQNTLKVMSSIYCKMFNNLQSYTNLADRISESNVFADNYFQQNNDLRAYNPDNRYQNNAYYNNNFFKHTNRFLNLCEFNSNFTLQDYKKYRSFASKKFVYFLNEILGIDLKEIELIMEKIQSKNIKIDNNTTVTSRYKRLINQSNNPFPQNNTSQIFENIINDNFDEFMTNPFEIFNLYTADLFQLIPGLYNNSDEIDANYQIDNTDNLTILNLFKAGNDLNLTDIVYSNSNSPPELIQIASNLSNSVFINEIVNMQKALTNLDLFSFINVINNQNKQEFNTFSNTLNVKRSVYSNIIPWTPNQITRYKESFRSNTPGQYWYTASDIADILLGGGYNNANTITEFHNNLCINIKDSSLDNNTILNKRNYKINPTLNAESIFEFLINPSFVLKENYSLTNFESVGIRRSGLNESYSYTQNFLRMKEIDSIGNNISGFNLILNKRYVDINLNWYNHIMHGLIINDLGLSMSFDFLLYYYKDFINDFERNFQKITQLRNNKALTRLLNVNEAKNNLSRFSNLDNNLTELSIDNFKIQQNYLKSLIKNKALANIVYSAEALNNIFSNTSDDKAIQKIVNLNGKNENGDFLMSYFDDFYIKNLWNVLKLGNYENFKNKINKNYEKYYDSLLSNIQICNQSEFLLGSHLLTVGINNEYKLDKDDIVLIKIEMIDHDFPEIVWEPKTFEYYAGFDDIENAFLQHADTLKPSTMNIITNETSPIQINSFYNEYTIEQSVASSLKDSLIKSSITENNVINDLNISNNIGSATYVSNNNISNLHPFTFSNNDEEILNILINSNENFIFSKINNTFKEQLTNEELQNIRTQLIKRCIHNQKMNLRFKKMSKLLNGFEGNPNFSLTKNEWMQDLFVLSDIYNLFIQNFNNNGVDNVKSIYPFTYEEISNAVEIEKYSYAGLKFHKMHFTTNPKLNIYLEFFNKFTKSLIPDFIDMTEHNFQKIYTMALNPKDFIVTGLDGENHDFIPVSSDLLFERVQYTTRDRITGRIITINNQYIDEIGTEPSLLLRLISDKTPQQDNINYYRIVNKKTNQQYIPKNVSYRITTTILE